MFRKILVGFDGSDGAKKALRRAIELAKASGTALHVVAVIEKLPHFAATMGEVKDALEALRVKYEWFVQEAIHEAEHEGVKATGKAVPGHEVETIVTAVKEGGHDLLVIGFMGHSRSFGGWAMGSTTQSLARLAPCSVMIVK